MAGRRDLLQVFLSRVQQQPDRSQRDAHSGPSIAAYAKSALHRQQRWAVEIVEVQRLVGLRGKPLSDPRRHGRPASANQVRGRGMPC